MQSPLLPYGCGDSNGMVASGSLTQGGGGGVAGVQPEWTPTACPGGADRRSGLAPAATATVALRASQKFANSGRLVKPS